MNLYDKASLILTPNAYKASKLYALKPTNGSGDFTFSRASAKRRRNASGVLEALANNVPALEYPVGGGCPAWLLEPQRTNLFLNSFAPVTQTITVVNGSTYTVSVSGGSAALSGAGSGTATTGTNVTFVASSTSLTVTISGAAVWCQVELGAYATSPIQTAGTSVTRVADLANITAVSSLIGQSEGVFYWEGTCQFLTDLVGVNQSTVNGLYITKGSGSLYRATIYANSVPIGFADVGIKTTKVKIALAYKSGDSALFVNGAQIGATNTTAFTFTGALSSVRLNDDYLIGRQANSVNAVILYPTRLSNAECIALTTL